MARVSSVRMPRSRAMATAVSIWSPVIMIGRMPASRHSRDRAVDLRAARGRSCRVRPMNTRSCSSVCGLIIRRNAVPGAASPRRERAARGRPSPWYGGRTFSLVFGVRDREDLARRTSSRSSARAASSGAPLVYCTMPAVRRCGRWTSFCGTESNGASPMRG